MYYKMFFPPKRLFLFIVILVPIISLVIAQNDGFKFQSYPGIDFSIPPKNSEVCTDEDKNHTENTSVNSSIPNVTTLNFTRYNCLTDKIFESVELVNATRLMELLTVEPGPTNRSRNFNEIKQTPGTCVLVLFYARWCIFSSQAAPYINALPRFIPHIKVVAIDAMKYQSFNAQYGIVGVPTLMLVHNGKPSAKFNGTMYTLESFVIFIMQFTNLKPKELLYVTSADFNGPVPSTPSNETDYCLVLSWVFILLCAVYFTLQTRWWKEFVELIQNTWRESNAQHDHAD